jgi:hypothetical protein
VHNIVSTQIKGRIPKIKRDYITYRSYSNFDHEKYVEDIEKIDYVNIGNESLHMEFLKNLIFKL